MAGTDGTELTRMSQYGGIAPKYDFTLLANKVEAIGGGDIIPAWKKLRRIRTGQL